MANDNNKDIANSLNKVTDYTHKGTNIILDSAENINKWYEKHLEKITENDFDSSRIETGIDNNIENNDINDKDNIQISTKVKKYNEIQTNKSNEKKEETKFNIMQTETNHKEQIKTKKILEKNLEKKSNNNTQILENKKDSKLRTNKRITATIKGIKHVNNATQKLIKTGKNINTGLNENSATSFENVSSRIMTKPIKKITNKTVSKIEKQVIKYGKEIGKRTNYKIKEKLGKKAIAKSSNRVMKLIRVVGKLIIDTINIILSMLPQIAPILIILVIIIAFCSYFGIGMSDETRNKYETYMINTQNSYDEITLDYYNSGKIVDGAIEGKGMINWKAPLSILQILNGDLVFDDAEKELLEKFKSAELFEKVTDSTYSYEKEVETTNEDGTVTTTKETVEETKKIVINSSLDDYIDWCNNNFNVINKYKQSKNLNYDLNQNRFTDNEVEQIRLLYNSNSFFELFSTEFKSTYAYLNVNIGDEQIKAIYDEFLKNVGKRYLMDHSNLKYNECMDYYDCSSWVIHCLSHTGIVTLSDTTADGIYKSYCNPIGVNDRKAGDLIFLKDTYDTGIPGSISHIGIYMGELTINGETDEWIIDTGGNPSGVRIRKYKNGWWNGPNFYGFARLK